MTTVAYSGYGSKLASGGTAGSSYTNVAQLKIAICLEWGPRRSHFS
jgi:hypothetical protein